jgi:hypothetical protein
MTAAVLVGCAVATLFVAVLGHLAGRRRGDRLAAYCRDRGWAYDEADPDLAVRWHGEPFVGSGAQIRTAVRGTVDGRPFTAFDHSIERAGLRVRHLVVVVHLPVGVGGGTRRMTGTPWRLEGSDAVTWQRGRLTPDLVEETVDQVWRAVTALPPHLWREPAP